MNILEIEDMVKGLPDDRLQQEAEMPTGQVPQFLVVSEIQRRSDMRRRFAERQQQQPQGTVKDQIIQEGIAAMAPPDQSMQAAMMGQQTGIGADDVIDLQNPEVRAALMSPMAMLESRTNISPQDIRSQIQSVSGVQEEPLGETRKTASVRGSRGNYTASVEGPGTRDASTTIPTFQRLMEEADELPRKEQFGEIIDYLRRGDVQYDEEGRERFAIDPAGRRVRSIPEATVFAQQPDLGGAVTTDAKRGLSTGTAFDPEVIRLATAPNSSGGLYSVTGQDLTAMSAEGEKTVRGGDASVQGPTGRQLANLNLRKIADPEGSAVSDMGLLETIDSTRRVNLENLIASAQTKDNQDPLFGPAFTPKFGPPVPPGFGEQGSTGRRTSIDNTDASNLTPLARRVLADPEGGYVSDMPLDAPIDSSRRTDASSVVPSQDSPISGINRDLISQLIRDPESVDFGTSLYRDAIRTAETTGTQNKGSTSGKILAPIEGSTIEEIANNIYSYRQPVIQSRRGSKPDNKYESREELFLRVFGEDAPGDALDAARSAYDLKFRAPYSPRFTDYALGSNALDQYLSESGNVAETTRGEVVQDGPRQENVVGPVVVDGSVVTAGGPGPGAGPVEGADADVEGTINNELIQSLIRTGTAVDGGALGSLGGDNRFITGGGSEGYKQLIDEVDQRRSALAERIRTQQAPSLDYSRLISESQASLNQQLEAIKSEKGAQALIALGAGIARGDLGAGLSDAGKAVAASNAQKRALQARQQALEAGLKKSQIDAVFQQAIQQEENQIKAEGMMIDALETAGVRKRDAEKFAMNYSLQLKTLDNQLKRWSNLDEQSRQRTKTAVLNFAESSLKNVIGIKPEDLKTTRDEAIRQAAIMYGLSPADFGLDSAGTATGETTTVDNYSYKEVSGQ
jgi:hypothetical protein